MILLFLLAKLVLFYESTTKKQNILEKISSYLLFIFISMVFKEFGGVRLFPFCEYVALG